MGKVHKGAGAAGASSASRRPSENDAVTSGKVGW